MGLKKALKITGMVVIVGATTGLLLPENLLIPVKGATVQDWNHSTFWHEPWGASGVHKGIDIFAPAGTDVVSAAYGVVLYSGTIRVGGNVLVILGPKWRVHYYAHLKDYNAGTGRWVTTGQTIATVGNSGNAAGKPSHLHYTIFSLIPYPWRWDNSNQGWKKMFFLDPSEKLLEKNSNPA